MPKQAVNMPIFNDLQSGVRMNRIRLPMELTFNDTSVLHRFSASRCASGYPAMTCGRAAIQQNPLYKGWFALPLTAE